MKRYIKSSYNPNVEEDSFDGEVVIYGIGNDVVRKPVRFVLQEWYALCYMPEENPELTQFLRANHCVGPMYDGDNHNGYRVYNRYETQAVYDMLST